jgi:hypothetical protein
MQQFLLQLAGARGLIGGRKRAEAAANNANKKNSEDVDPGR